MRQLVFPGDSFLKCEKNVRDYLTSLSDEELKNFYDAIEFTHFPIILSQEYKRRFGKKSNATKKKKSATKR